MYCSGRESRRRSILYIFNSFSYTRQKYSRDQCRENRIFTWFRALVLVSIVSPFLMSRDNSRFCRDPQLGVPPCKRPTSCGSDCVRDFPVYHVTFVLKRDFPAYHVTFRRITCHTPLTCRGPTVCSWVIRYSYVPNCIAQPDPLPTPRSGHVNSHVSSHSHASLWGFSRILKEKYRRYCTKYINRDCPVVCTDLYSLNWWHMSKLWDRDNGQKWHEIRQKRKRSCEPPNHGL